MFSASGLAQLDVEATGAKNKMLHIAPSESCSLFSEQEHLQL